MKSLEGFQHYKLVGGILAMICWWKNYFFLVKVSAMLEITEGFLVNCLYHKVLEIVICFNFTMIHSTTCSLYFHDIVFTLSLSGTKINDPTAAKFLTCFMEKAEELSLLK